MYRLPIQLLFMICTITHTISQRYACNSRQAENSKVYCNGNENSYLDVILRKHEFYTDPKNFVDSPLKTDLKTLESRWKNVDYEDREKVRKFIIRNFAKPGTELKNCTPSDWKKEPKKIRLIQDKGYREFALKVNNIWPELCKEIDSNWKERLDRTSIIYVPNKFIAPGDRFREYYYWDTYWIIRGLLVSEMYTTAKDMIKNLLYLVNEYGFVPNGGRVYYLNRSQPPMLTYMIYDYCEITGDYPFLLEEIEGVHVLVLMQKEYMYWQSSHKVNLNFRIHGNLRSQAFSLYRYRASMNTPRPESFNLDVKTAEGLRNDKKTRLYKNIATAAESGWDFSSRWMSRENDLSSTSVDTIVPLDLNALLCGAALRQKKLMLKIHNEPMTKYFHDEYLKLKRIIHKVFWNEEEGAWFDLNVTSQHHNKKFTAASIVPLWAGCAAEPNFQASKLYDYYKRNAVLDRYAGIPATLKDTDQQWDFPNAWPNMVHMTVEAFRATKNNTVQNAALHLAEEWLILNLEVLKEKGHMFEKYDTRLRKPGVKGEYKVSQIGFGWTNGVALDLMYTYRDRLHLSEEKTRVLALTEGSAAIQYLGHIVLVLTMNLFLFGKH